MVISNNATAGFILGTLNKNINKKNKASSQLALGEKIRNAGDDASGYAISERMRVRIRALGQSDANVQNGASMLRVAEGAIQSQINLLRTVKEKVIDAHNDTNTDTDRAIIQKEITEYYNEINDIAAETTFNGKHLLLGTEVSEAVKSWYRLDHAEKLDGSDKFSFVSGTADSFDGYNVKQLSSNAMSGGTPDAHNVISITIGRYTSESTIDNTSFNILYPGGSQTFVFTRNPNQHFRGDNLTVIDIEHVSALSDAINTLRNKISSLLHVDYDPSPTDRTNRRIVLTTVAGGDITNDKSLYDVVGVSLAGGDGYTATSPLPSSMITNSQSGKNGATASWTMDLSNYNVSSSSAVDNFISEYAGKAIHHSGNDKYYEFIDSSASPKMDSISKINGSTIIDLNNLRSAVNSGKTVAEAFANLMISKMGSSLVTSVTNGSGQVTGVNFNATVRGTEGNSQKISIVEGNLQEYTIDFKSLLGGVTGADIPGKLDGQGFRVYDALDANKWVNVLFVNGVNQNDDPRPASGGSGMDIDTLVIDVSDVDSVNSLLKTLYKGDGEKNKQGLSQFLGKSDQNFRAAADFDSGTITIYDTRKYDLYDGSTEKRDTIANGIMDDVVNDYRNTYVNDLVIQHTDKSSANIHVRIPQTTLDQVFGYKVGAGSLDDYTVLTSENREFLLGQDYPTPIKGALDKGIQYLIDANTLIGAQIVHMESADANIITEQENTTAAESTIRDADIAKSAMDHATANILSQSTMAMLSQFNHSSSDVLGLLQ
ncbi:flagellin [Anaerovibrio lipolyticus]|uniref:flagellin N-terminal helical domain-containing protein n=1 Tax=Anaerovibrio lipolyticus TaxID=82374 RepID=UPI000688C8CD|nr:flagellin [Anaerovibrio lipolyticus]